MEYNLSSSKRVKIWVAEEPEVQNDMVTKVFGHGLLFVRAIRDGKSS